MMSEVCVVLRVNDRHLPKARYVFDTLFMAAGVSVHYVSSPPPTGPWLLYGELESAPWSREGCLVLSYCPKAWEFFDGFEDVREAQTVDGFPVVLPSGTSVSSHTSDIAFDLPANAFYFLSSWSERRARAAQGRRQLHADSVFVRLGIPQDVVDRYLQLLRSRWSLLCVRLGCPESRFGPGWPGGAAYAVVLSHDIDYLPKGMADVLAQGARTLLRHLVRHRDPLDAARSALGLAQCLFRGLDPYGCVPAIIAEERKRGVRSSFQVAVAHRHPADVNYSLMDLPVRAYLRGILDEGFDLCLHGSYRSTEDPAWYAEEVELLTNFLQRPIGNRQHFLSFDYDVLFSAQERNGIRYDMSMGFPDRPGPRAGFSFPYYPYCLDEDRPYQVVELGLSIMDVTLRGYLNQKGAAAWDTIEAVIAALRATGGCASIVWHPIVFGGARDPGFDALYWRLVERVIDTGGIATDGRTIDRFWRERSSGYPSFSGVHR